jgi:hypothetical protein
MDSNIKLKQGILNNFMVKIDSIYMSHIEHI